MEVRNYINGKFVNSISKKKIPVLNPSNQNLVESIDEALRNTRLRLLESELAMILAAEESLQVSTVPFPVPPALPPGN